MNKKNFKKSAKNWLKTETINHIDTTLLSLHATNITFSWSIKRSIKTTKCFSVLPCLSKWAIWPTKTNELIWWAVWHSGKWPTAETNNSFRAVLQFYSSSAKIDEFPKKWRNIFRQFPTHWLIIGNRGDTIPQRSLNGLITRPCQQPPNHRQGPPPFAPRTMRWPSPVGLAGTTTSNLSRYACNSPLWPCRIWFPFSTIWAQWRLSVPGIRLPGR